jgi:hypothetical protein
LDDYRDSVEAELDRATPTTLAVEDHIPLATLEHGERYENPLQFYALLKPLKFIFPEDKSRVLWIRTDLARVEQSYVFSHL